jgi:hypothetical protein
VTVTDTITLHAHPAYRARAKEKDALEARGPEVREVYEAARAEADRWRGLAASVANAVREGFTAEEVAQGMQQSAAAARAAHFAVEKNKVDLANAEQAVEQEAKAAEEHLASIAGPKLKAIVERQDKARADLLEAQAEEESLRQEFGDAVRVSSHHHRTDTWYFPRPVAEG